MVIKTSINKNMIKRLKVKTRVFLSGTIYTLRDQAHKRLVEDLTHNKKIPFDIRNKIIYYCAPTQKPNGKIIGACGPTTSSRMDAFTPFLLKKGLVGMIGKGRRGLKVIKAIKKYKGVYFLTYSGCGALLSKYVRHARPIAYKDLGPEAIYELEVERFPLIVGIDSKGRKIYG
jgi:fumarate hydratase subunit beta